jgi:hypothetical protein
MESEYKKFPFWTKFAQTFFNTKSGIVKIHTNSDFYFEFPLSLLPRLFFIWVHEGGCRFSWQIDNVTESITTGNNLRMEGNFVWHTDFDNGLASIRQSGKLKIIFQSSDATVDYFEWYLEDQKIFYSNHICGIIPDCLDITQGGTSGFPKAVTEFLTKSTIISNVIRLKEIQEGNEASNDLISPVSPLEDLCK